MTILIKFYRWKIITMKPQQNMKCTSRLAQFLTEIMGKSDGNILPLMLTLLAPLMSLSPKSGLRNWKKLLMLGANMGYGKSWNLHIIYGHLTWFDTPQPWHQFKQMYRFRHASSNDVSGTTNHCRIGISQGETRQFDHQDQITDSSRYVWSEKDG